MSAIPNTIVRSGLEDLILRLAADAEAGRKAAATNAENDRRRRIRNTTFERQRKQALADPNITALQKARLRYGGAGITQRELAAMSGVCVRTIRRGEQGHFIADETWQRLAIALQVKKAKLQDGAD